MSSRRSMVVLLVLLVVFGAAVVTAVLSLRGDRRVVSGPTVLVWRVPSELDESPPPLRTWSLQLLRSRRPTVWDVVHALDRAARDGSVEGLVLHVDGIDWGLARVAEVREALLRFRASGKPLDAVLTAGGEREYLLVSAAGRIAVPPLSVLQLDGLVASALFWRGTYDKLDIRPNFASVGAYKSGVEPYTREGMSAPARAALEALLDDHLAALTDTLARARGMSREAMRRRIEEGPYQATVAVDAGLADTVLHEEEVDSLALGRARAGAKVASFLRYVEHGRSSRGGAPIALVLAEGDLSEGHSRELPFGGRVLGSETLIDALRDAGRRSSVRAIVLRIDSPGGSAPAAEAVWHEVERVGRKKPIFVSMSDLAASGGYYIAAAAESIVAHPATLTGSIGVYGGKLNVIGLYRKIGLNVESVTRGSRAGMMSPYRDFTAEELDVFRAQLATIYETFLDRVRAGRGLDAARADSVAQGRVWSGTRARAEGLVDALGGFDRALRMARESAGLDPGGVDDVELYPRERRTFLQNLLADMLPDRDEDLALVGLASDALRAHASLEALWRGRPLARLPYDIEIR